jgi:hypothetical protein
MIVLRLRQALIAAVAVVMALTSVSLAMAHGTTRIGGQVVVLCSGDGLVQVELDADGNPVGSVHLCPDIALAVLAHVALPEVLPERPAGRTMAVVLPPRVEAPSRDAVETRVRDPPAAV